MNGNSSFVAEFEGLWRRPLADYRQAIQTYTIAIDTNVLLDLYRFTPKARHELLDLLRKVQERLWVPHQVAKEYFARRIDALKDQLDLYESVPRELKTLHDRAITQVNTFARRCSLSDKDKEALSDPLRKALASVMSEIERHRNSLDLTLAKVASNDPILEALADILDGRTGQSFTTAEESNLLEDYSERAAAKVPPGYKDASKAENPHGDFFVWEQMMRHSKERGRPTLFITSDVKEDWFHRAAGIPVGARPELIAEMQERAECDFLILQLSSFLKESKEALGAEVSEATYEAAKNVALESSLKEKSSYFAIPREMYESMHRRLSDSAGNALGEWASAQSEGMGEPRTIEHAIKTRLADQRKVEMDRAMDRLQAFEDCLIVDPEAKTLELWVDEKKTAKMINELLHEASPERLDFDARKDTSVQKGSPTWVSRLTKALAPYVDGLAPRTITEESVTYQIGEIANADTGAIRGLARSFDVDINLLADNGAIFTAWARR
ncbi:PIN domain-containing protein [Streptomyces sp. NPDC004673]